MKIDVQIVLGRYDLKKITNGYSLIYITASLMANVWILYYNYYQIINPNVIFSYEYIQTGSPSPFLRVNRGNPPADVTHSTWTVILANGWWCLHQTQNFCKVTIHGQEVTSNQIKRIRNIEYHEQIECFWQIREWKLYCLKISSHRHIIWNFCY